MAIKKTEPAGLWAKSIYYEGMRRFYTMNGAYRSKRPPDHKDIPINNQIIKELELVLEKSWRNLKMRNLFLAAILLTGCSEAFINRISTEKYTGKETKPYTTEWAVNVPNHFGTEKRLYIHNPLPVPITVKLACVSMFQNDGIVKVPARTSKFIMITAPTNREGPSCYISDFYAD